MERKHAFILSFLITTLIASNYFFFSSLAKNNFESVTIRRVIDGDTIQLKDGRTVRLLNINSPEKSTPSYKLSMDYLKTFEGDDIQIENLGYDKYHRTLARIYSPDYINLEIVKKGLASKFLVDKSELSVFNNAEKEAISLSLGIWKKSEYYGCIKTEINKKLEIVVINNKCGEINMLYWQLKDESRKTYSFKNVSFTTVSLHSLAGKDNSSDLFWNSDQNVWNNDRDSLYLFDNEGGLVYYESYGY